MDTDTETPARSLPEQTVELGRMLKAIGDAEPSGQPSAAAAAAFATWVREAGPLSLQPGHFQDVLENYDVAANSNRDLAELFHMLETYLEIPDTAWPDTTPKTYIDLPLLGA